MPALSRPRGFAPWPRGFFFAARRRRAGPAHSGPLSFRPFRNVRPSLKRSALLYQGLFLLLASYGVLYFSYKYYLPWFGGDDFAEYYKMYLAPLDSRQAQAPFVYRQLGALITSLIHKAGLYYPSRIAFIDPAYDQRVFFAALFSNYLALLASAVSVCMTLNRLTQGRLLFAPLMGGLLPSTASRRW